MPRPTTKVEVSQRLESRLAVLIPAFADRIYPMVREKLPAAAIRDQEVLTYQWLGGSFDYPRQVGAGALGVAYQGTVKIAAWVRNESDEQGSDRALLFDDDTGLLHIEHAMLKLADDCLDGGDPLDPIIEDGIKVLSDDGPDRRAPDENFGSSGYEVGMRGVMAVTFGLAFVWDLQAATAAALLVRPDPPVN